MLFINDKNEYPRHIGDLQIAFPGWQVGDSVPNTWQEVAYATDYPEIQQGQVYEQLEPKLVNGVLTQQIVVRDLSEDEKDAMKMQEIRNKVYMGMTITAEEAALLVG